MPESVRDAQMGAHEVIDLEASPASAPAADAPPTGAVPAHRRPDHAPRAHLWPVAAVGVAMVAFVLIKIGRDSIFFSCDAGLRSLPLAYIGIGLLAVPAALLHVRLMRRLGSRPARVVLFVGAAATTAAFVPFMGVADSWIMTAFFVFVPVLFAAVFASAWLLAGDLLEGASAELRRRTYARVGAASTLGGVVGGGAAKALAHFMEARFLVLAGATMLLVTAAITWRAQRKNPVKPERLPPSSASPAPPLFLLKQPFVRLLAGISALAAVAGLLIEFQFYALSTLSGSADSDYFANFYILLSASAFVLQLSVAPLIQSRVGVAGTLLVMPIILFGAGAAVAFSATLLGRATLKVTESGLKSAIHRVAWEQAFLPLAREARARAKALIDGGSARVAEGVTALLLYAMMVLGGTPNLVLLAIATLVVVLAWIGLTLRMRRFRIDEVGSEVVDPRLPDGCPIAASFGPSCPKVKSTE